MDEFSGIVYCPVCCTNDDVMETGWQELECNNCGTEFRVKVDSSTFAEHSPH